MATERGYNLYVCGNGGVKPRHADLLAADVDEATAIRYIDRFLMYYIMTADRLTRTAVWLEKLEGGIEHLKEVIIEDKLGICQELEERLQFLVDTYTCEWAEVVKDPEKRKWFRQFVNTDETEPCIEIMHERGQPRPGDWPSETVSLVQLKRLEAQTRPAAERSQGGAAYLGAGGEGARLSRTMAGPPSSMARCRLPSSISPAAATWYACQQMCPHKKAFVLSRGILGDTHGTPKIACPLHKKTFALDSGACLSGEDYAVQVFPVQVKGDDVYLELPPSEVLDKLLATEIGVPSGDFERGESGDCGSLTERSLVPFPLGRDFAPSPLAAEGWDGEEARPGHVTRLHPSHLSGVGFW